MLWCYEVQKACLYGRVGETVEVRFVSALRYKSLFGIGNKQSGEESTEQ